MIFILFVLPKALEAVIRERQRDKFRVVCVAQNLLLFEYQ